MARTQHTMLRAPLALVLLSSTCTDCRRRIPGHTACNTIMMTGPCSSLIQNCAAPPAPGCCPCSHPEYCGRAPEAPNHACVVSYSHNARSCIWWNIAVNEGLDNSWVVLVSKSPVQPRAFCRCVSWDVGTPPGQAAAGQRTAVGRQAGLAQARRLLRSPAAPAGYRLCLHMSKHIGRLCNSPSGALKDREPALPPS